jgi:hypothetical protein
MGDKTATANDNFHEELKCVLDKFLKYQSVFKGFNNKWCSKDIFKLTTGNEGLYEISNDNSIITVNSATYKKTELSRVQYSHITAFTCI